MQEATPTLNNKNGIKQSSNSMNASEHGPSHLAKSNN
jgi:hypothetical protein